MVSKTPKAFAACSSNNVLSLFAVPAHHTSITSPPRPRPPPSIPALKQTNSRCYATVDRNDAPRPPNDSAKTAKGPGKPGSPPSWPACANPTPYDIFDIDKAAPYTKSRFAELVKQYHPDKHHASALDSLPAHTRLERYRLVVLANEILSSPDKRRAYDAFGAHWQIPGAADGLAGDPRDIHEVYRETDKAWRRAGGNPSANATWEDWERWHHRRANGGADRQAPLYMSNASFAALVIAALAVGTVAQTTRMENSSAHILEKKDAHEAHIAEALRRQGEATAGKGREERIERFLRERENINFGFMPAKLDVRPAPSAK
ncbi:DnaJ domain-containing protein [Colletotrichum graminicola]|uniref:DnaJ domain-containing protein n=1 Tax=Colletotrichum graminicola (strain M1.001 / M2 / FGSC 10212) TaxID=645133 RepID=E3QXQ2_COLGM|nr:DnaJ domain-containing protein [Colletotrichum graminicola M1.001]EFQ35655.1 DnaJ domain-containing protein [Colletotrichum graminicola M1.001]WDK18554.1 DnaJ domain-containing protein [Colletotrichum graminicola]